MRYLVEGTAIVRIECDDDDCLCDWGRHDEKDNIVIVVDAFDEKEAIKMALEQWQADRWVQPPTVRPALPADVIRTPDKERKALEQWQAAAKAWVQ